MDLLTAQDGLYDLFMGKAGPRARAGALLLGSVLLANRPELPEIVLDLEDG